MGLTQPLRPGTDAGIVSIRLGTALPRTRLGTYKVRDKCGPDQMIKLQERGPDGVVFLCTASGASQVPVLLHYFPAMQTSY